jgi:hypothetical protein
MEGVSGHTDKTTLLEGNEMKPLGPREGTRTQELPKEAGEHLGHRTDHQGMGSDLAQQRKNSKEKATLLGNKQDLHFQSGGSLESPGYFRKTLLLPLPRLGGEREEVGRKKGRGKEILLEPKYIKLTKQSYSNAKVAGESRPSSAPTFPLEP